MHRSIHFVFALLLAVSAHAAELARSAVYSVVEITFSGPTQKASDAPARDVELWARIRHESGQPEYRLPGYYDGDGKGGLAGNVFKVRFCPTQPGRWTITEVKSNVRELNGQHQGATIAATAAPSSAKGFWLVDEQSPGKRWYKRSNGAHDYIVGNTMYSFLSETYYGGRPNGSSVARDIRGNADYFKKIRFSVPGDLYPHATVAPFIDEAGNPTYNGDNSHRPNPQWFQQRVDVAVRTAHERDLITDLITSGVDREDSRSAIRAAKNNGDSTPYLRYLVARYGAFTNVWFCVQNEYDIRTPKYTATQARDFGVKMQALLVYPNPLSIHRASGHWPPDLDSSPAWNDHRIIQKKMKTIPATVDFMIEDHAGRPVVNDELAYEGAGDRFTEEDVVESHLGAFLAGGYGTTGYKSSTGRPGAPLPSNVSVGADGLKPGEKLGQYFAGNFDAAEHTSADNLKFLRETIDAKITFWKMAPEPATKLFANAHEDFRLLAAPGSEYVLGTNRAQEGIVAKLPAGKWTVTAYDVMAKTAKIVSSDASGEFKFASPVSRAAFFHFKRQ